MATEAEVELVWLSAAQGGRKNLPEGLSYAGVAKFDVPVMPGDATAWSVVLEFKEPPRHNLQQGATMRFLVEHVDRALLRSGMQFTLIEGTMRVATGKIVLGEGEPSVE